MNNLRIVPEPRKSSLDELAENIDQDPAFQRAVGKKVNPPSGSPADEDRAGCVLQIGHARLVPCAEATDVMNGIMSGIGKEQGTKNLLKWKSEGQGVFLSSNAAYAVLLQLLGMPENAKKIMDEIEETVGDLWYEITAKSTLMTYTRHRKQVADMQTNAWLALAYSVLPLDKGELSQKIMTGILRYIGYEKGTDRNARSLVFHSQRNLDHEVGGGNPSFMDLAVILPMMIYANSAERDIANSAWHADEYKLVITAGSKKFPGKNVSLKTYSVVATSPHLGASALSALLQYVMSTMGFEMGRERLENVEDYFTRVDFGTGGALRQSWHGDKPEFITLDNVVYALACMAREGAKHGEVANNV